MRGQNFGPRVREVRYVNPHGGGRGSEVCTVLSGLARPPDGGLLILAIEAKVTTGDCRLS